MVDERFDELLHTLCADYRVHNNLNLEARTNSNIKRGLRNEDGTGVMVGCTAVGNVLGYTIEDGERVPMPGRLIYRGYDLSDLVDGYIREQRFGFPEVAYLLLFGHLPDQEQYDMFKRLLHDFTDLPQNFTEDMILKNPSHNVMNKLGRSVLALYSCDPDPDSLSVENMMRQSIELIARFPVIAAYAYVVKRHYFDNDSLYLHRPEPELSTAENILSLLRPDSSYSFWEAHVLDICQKADLVFLGLHGMDGEDGRIQAALDLLGVPYTGAGHLASAVAMDKAVSKQILDACGIPTPKWRLLSHGLDEAEPLAQTLPMPCVIKTIGGGSSLGVYLPEDRTELKRALEEVLRYGAKVLAEERIYGRELTVAVLGDRWLPAVETVPAGKEFDYVAKYQAGAAVETCPADVPPAVMQAAGELALRTHRALGLEVYSRTDMILDKDGNLWVLEANSLPGMTPNSFVPKEAAAVGMSYNQLCEEIVRLSCDVKRRG